MMMPTKEWVTEVFPSVLIQMRQLGAWTLYQYNFIAPDMYHLKFHQIFAHSVQVWNNSQILWS